MNTASVSNADFVSPGQTQASLGRVFTLAYGLVCYLSFVVAFGYAIGFVGNWLVPKGIDDGTPGPLLPSLLINGGLLSLFVLQHTIMARPAFKRWWTKVIPAPIERSTFVLLASSILLLTFWQWRSLPQLIWSVEGWPAAALSIISLCGYAIVFIASCTISHFDLFGLRQTWIRFNNRPYTPVGFRLAGFYRLVRHPLMVGFLIAFWATPKMSVGHLFFSIMTTLYILFGTFIEERDLIAQHGEEYLTYKRRVRGLLPLPKAVRIANSA